MTTQALKFVPGSEAPATMRDPGVVMQPERLGAMRQSRLSFSRQLVAKATREGWQFARTRLDIDATGNGTALYRIDVPDGYRFGLIVFSHARPEVRTDRAWEPTWDILVWLVEGDVDDARIEYARSQNAAIVLGGGRAGPDTLSWTRGNRSSRLFEHAVSMLAEGKQPDSDMVRQVGYFIRNIYYQANGMNGTRMFGAYPESHPLSGSFQAQMLGLFMMREFSIDLVEATACARSPKAVPLAPSIRRFIGVGNATGIGLNLVAANHPLLVSRWLTQREDALARIFSLPAHSMCGRLSKAVSRYEVYLRQSPLPNEGVTPKDVVLRELGVLRRLCDAVPPDKAVTVADALSASLARADVETQEIFNSLLLEVNEDICAAVECDTVASEAQDIDPSMTVAAFRRQLQESFRWALEQSTGSADDSYWIWYRSMDGEEPRLSVAAEGHVDQRYNLVVNYSDIFKKVLSDIDSVDEATSIARFLLRFPVHRATVQTVQSLAAQPYALVRANMLERQFTPRHLTRFVLQALKGMDKPDFAQDRWVQGVFLQGAPLAADISAGTAEADWAYPEL